MSPHVTDPLPLLLSALATSPDTAGRGYEHLRARLVARFRARSLPDAETLADETFDRVARKLAAGARPDDVIAYTLGVSRLLALEAMRRCRRYATLEGELHAPAEPSPDERAAYLDVLSEPARQLLLRYQTRAERARLARELGISVNALRIRVHRLREKVLARAAAA